MTIAAFSGLTETVRRASFAPVPSNIHFPGYGYKKGFDSFFAIVSTSFVNGYPYTPIINNTSAINANTFADDYFSKTRYFPSSLELGAITSSQVRQLYVYNCFRHKSTLTSIDLPTGAGIEVVGPIPPTLYQKLDIVNYTVNIDIEGPATIDTTIDFNWFTPVPLSSVPVRGSRIVSYPYLFSAGMTETLQWATQVMVSIDGTEKRVRLRNSPRQNFSVESFIPRKQWNISDNLLYAWRSNTWGVPVFHECRNITSPTSTSSPVVEVSTAYGDFRQGELAIIYLSDELFEIIQIQSFTGTSITAEQNITRVYPTSALVAPVVPGRLTDNPVRQTTGASVILAAQFQSTQNITLSTSPSATQYLGYDVLPYEQLIEGAYANDSYVRRTEVIDYVSSNVKTFSKWNHTKPTRTFELMFEDLEELWNFRLWLHRRAGKLVPFWAPTQEGNFLLVTTGLIGSSFVARDDEQSTLGLQRNHILIRTKSSGDLYREITDNVRITEGVSVTVTPPINVDASDITSIEYIGLKRLNSDRIEILHLQNFKATVSLPVIEIEP